MAQQSDLFENETELLESLGDEKKNEPVVAPVPIVNPTFGVGLALGGMSLYQLDEGSQPSFTAAAGAYTDSESYALGIGQTAYFKGDGWKIAAGAGVGVRLKLSKTTGLNLSVDFAVGKDSDAWYSYVG